MELVYFVFTPTWHYTTCASISRLAKSQEEIAHVVDEIISVINITKVEICMDVSHSF